jgi:predicted ATPase
MPAAADLPHGVIGDAPKSVRLYGRTAELNALNQWIGKDRCRLVGVWGISGVGKTAVVRKLIDQTDGLFDTVI